MIEAIKQLVTSSRGDHFGCALLLIGFFVVVGLYLKARAEAIR